MRAYFHRGRSRPSVMFQAARGQVTRTAITTATIVFIRLGTTFRGSVRVFPAGSKNTFSKRKILPHIKKSSAKGPRSNSFEQRELQHHRNDDHRCLALAKKRRSV